VTTAAAHEPVPSDAELITASREGSSEAYAELYNRHRAAAYNLARQLARSQAEADDLVSEAFARLLDTLRSGGGPDSAFRAYLLTALRHCAYDRTRRERKIELSDDVSAYDPGVPFTDTAVAGLDRSLAARAFARLPERWQTVLWHTEIEGQSPADVAPLLGLTPNGVSALAYRAREGLRQAYLQVHLADTAVAGAPTRELDRCRAAVDRLGAWTRAGLSRRETAQVEQHLDECDRCRALAAELADVNGGLRVFVAPLVLGGAAAGYLTAAAAAKGAATAAAGTAAAGAAGAGGSGGGAGGAASTGPRQFLTVGGSTAALVAAIVLGLLAGPGEEVRPQAAPPSPPATGQPPVPPPPPPGQPPVPPGQPPAPPRPQPPTQQPEPPPPAPAPGQPSFTVSAPTQSIELEAGGAPVTLPITVRNGGSGQSEPVAVQLNLPSGVTATGTGTSTPPRSSAVSVPAATSPQAAGPQAASPQATGPQAAGPQAAGIQALAATPAQVLAQGGGVSCSGGTGTIRCATAQGLPPGGQAQFVFTLRAGPDAVGGEVTGTISGGNIRLRLASVRVVVRPAPDAIDLRASVSNDKLHARLTIQVIDVGRTSGQVVTTVALPDGVYAASVTPGCNGAHGTVTCRAALTPGRQVTWQLVLTAKHPVHSGATITAVMGTARQSRTVLLQLSGPCYWPPGLPLLPITCPDGKGDGGLLPGLPEITLPPILGR
jgi:RNA polymerase sigma factor (sigma-70 family)